MPFKVCQWVWSVALVLLAADRGVAQSEDQTQQSTAAASHASLLASRDCPPLPWPPEFLTTARTGYLGTRSCSAVACHGNAEAAGIEEQEFVHWIENDPHAASHLSLESESGRRMMRLLKIEKGDRGYQNCAACHDPYAGRVAGQDHNDAVVKLGEGVGCEACHGPSQNWVGEHYKYTFVNAAPAIKAQWMKKNGMIHTADVAVRSRLCATCHVGASDREVNHDMIAAGHPPLKFEMSAYHDQLPAHWDEIEERFLQRDFELRLWGIGQLASARAALEVLQTRAQRAHASTANSTDSDSEFPHGAWPELSEYSCFSCHQDLRGEGWRTPPQDEKLARARARGMATWNSWYLSLPYAQWAPDMTKDPLVIPQDDLGVSLGELRQIMDQEYDTDPAKVAKLAKSCVVELDRLLNAFDVSIATPRTTQTGLMRPLQRSLRQYAGQSTGDERLVRSWDSATQLYLALCALHQARADAHITATSGPRVPLVKDTAQQLLRLRQRLAFDQEYDSPANFRGAISREGSAHDDASHRTLIRNSLLELME